MLDAELTTSLVNKALGMIVTDRDKACLLNVVMSHSGLFVDNI